MSWEPVLEPGRNTRINFDLSEIIVNIKTEFEKLIAEIAGSSTYTLQAG